MTARKLTVRRTVRRGGPGAAVARGHAWSVAFWTSRKEDALADIAVRPHNAAKHRGWAHEWLVACARWRR
jgi:hypothetical protein